MSECKCESVKIYDGEHRCMKCYKLFVPYRLPRYSIDPNAYCSMAELARNEDAVNKLGTKRIDNLPLGVRPNE